MPTTFRYFLIASVGLAVGGLVGFYSGYSLSSSSNAGMSIQANYDRSIVAVREAATTLVALDHGRLPDARNRLSEQLDIALSDVGLYRSLAEIASCEDSLLSALVLARSYRATHPDTTHAQPIKAAADRTLNLCLTSVSPA